MYHYFICLATVLLTSSKDRFQIKQRTFEHQYAQMYHHRLAKMKPWALAAAAKKWNSDNSTSTNPCAFF